MPKFYFTLTETIERTAEYFLHIKKKEVVDYCELEPGDDWEDSVEQYITDNWAGLKPTANTESDCCEEIADINITDLEKDE